MRAGTIYITLLFLCTQGSMAQSNQMLRSQAFRAEAEKDWYGASQYYNRLYMRDSTDVKINYKYAEACRKNFETDLSLHLYKSVVASGNVNRFPLSYYWIGQLEKTRGNYTEAKKWFMRFNKLHLTKEKYSYYTTRSKQEVDNCDYAVALIENPVLSELKPFKGTINSKLSEYAPYEHDSVLYFSSMRPAAGRGSAAEVVNSKIYASRIRNGKSMKVSALDTVINANRFHTANICFSEDGQERIISRCTAINASDFKCELYSSSFIRKRWQTPVRMNEPVNDTTSSTTQPAFGKLGGKTVLFFSGNRKGGEGGMDIWYCYRNSDGTYSQPVNAGKGVNTSDDEISPWFDSESGTLFFSSTFHKNLGGFDIFRSVYSGSGFGEALNAGYPINTGYNESYYSVNNTGTRAYLSSNRPGSQFEGKPNCCNDIYSYDIDTITPPPVVEIDTTAIVKEQIKLLVPLTLFFNNDEPEPRTRDTVTQKTYEQTYKIYLDKVSEYRKQFSRDLKGEEKERAVTAIENFFTDSVEAGFDNLERFVDLLEKVLLNGETVKITMKGYCSPLASSDYNIKLAKRRISSLRNYFLSTRNGLLVKYVDNTNEGEGKIIFENEDIGELAETKASDDFRDKRNSVYNPFAASERKIQIIAVSFGTSGNSGE